MWGSTDAVSDKTTTWASLHRGGVKGSMFISYLFITPEEVSYWRFFNVHAAWLCEICTVWALTVSHCFMFSGTLASHLTYIMNHPVRSPLGGVDLSESDKKTKKKTHMLIHSAVLFSLQLLSFYFVFTQIRAKHSFNLPSGAPADPQSVHKNRFQSICGCFTLNGEFHGITGFMPVCSDSLLDDILAHSWYNSTPLWLFSEPALTLDLLGVENTLFDIRFCFLSDWGFESGPSWQEVNHRHQIRAGDVTPHQPKKKTWLQAAAQCY